MKYLVKIVIVLLLISWAWRYGRETVDRWMENGPVISHFSAPLTAGSLPALLSGEHFSSAENLERLDYEGIRRAHRSIDIAMYAFTDRRLAAAVIAAARRGVKVRIYRDGEQYEEEQGRAWRYGSTSGMFRGQPNIHIRVKSPSRWLLMHEKCVCVDHALLRTGSANWSPSGVWGTTNVADEESISYKGCFIRKLLILGSTSELSHRLPVGRSGKTTMPITSLIRRQSSGLSGISR